jgi:hypothetical protein
VMTCPPRYPGMQSLLMLFTLLSGVTKEAMFFLKNSICCGFYGNSGFEQHNDNNLRVMVLVFDDRR